MSDYDFALQWLDYRGIEIYNKDKRILEYHGNPQFEISPLNTRIESGVEFAEDDDEVKIQEMSFLDLERMGFMIKVGNDIVWRPGQRSYHKIVHKQNNIIGLNWDAYRKAKQLTNLIIEHDPANRRIRLKGNNVLCGKGMPLDCGVSDWVCYGADVAKKRNVDYGNYEDFSRDMLKEMYGDAIEEDADYTDIPEIPVMRTDDNYIVCMPKLDTPQRILILGRSRTGKCQPKGSKVLSVDGTWKNIEDVKVGDEVISPQLDGSCIFSKVVEVCSWYSEDNYEVRQKKRDKKKLYECSANHLIPVYHSCALRDKIDYEKRIYVNKIVNYEASHLSKLKRMHCNNFGFSTFAISSYKDRVNCKIEPYSLGVFLGDGCYTYRKWKKVNKNYDLYNKLHRVGRKSVKEYSQSTNHISITSADIQILQEVSKYYPIMSIDKKKGTTAKAYNFSIDGEFGKLLREYGLNGRTSGFKFIPKDALLSDIEYRKRLLAGLIDTDGFFDTHSGQHQIVTKSPQLAEDILNLVYSIGARGNIRKIKKQIKAINFIGEYFSVDCYLHNIKLPLVLERKTKKFITKHMKGNSISIELIKSKPAQVYGITIDSPSQFYITDNWMVTHNSVLTNSLSGRIFYKWEERVGWMMDPMNQLHSLSLPQDYNMFNKINLTIGDDPKPIPAVQLYLASKGKIEFRNPNISLLLTLSFNELLHKFKIYSYGIDDWKIEGSTRYVTEHISKISKIKDPDEIYDIMEDVMEIDFEKDQGKFDMVKKWVATFKTIFDAGFISNIYKDSCDELTIKRKDGSSFTGHPFIALLEAGCVPVVNTSHARSARWVRNYLADMMYKIYYHQMTSKPKKRVWIINDEMNEIYERGNDLATKNFETFLFRQAAFNNIGFIGNSQSLEKLNKEMFKNATHICCFHLQDSKDRKKVREAFGGGDLAKDTALDSMMMSLKKYEMVMFVSPDQDVVVYDRWGRRNVVSGTEKVWWKGKVFPPINHHQVIKDDEKKSEV